MIVARARLAAIRSRTRSSRRFPSPITKHRSAPEMEAATHRAEKRPVVTAAKRFQPQASDLGTTQRNSQDSRLQIVIPARQPVNPRSKVLRRALSGPASTGRGRIQTRPSGTAASTRGMPASAAASTRLIPNKPEITAVAAATVTMSARASSRDSMPRGGGAIRAPARQIEASRALLGTPDPDRQIGATDPAGHESRRSSRPEP